MRAILPLLLLVPALAGCLSPGGDDEDGLQVTCPQWTVSRNRSTYHANWYNNDTVQATNPRVDERIGDGLEHNRSRPLDRFDVEIARVSVHDGILRGHASTMDSGRRLVFQGEGDRMEALEFGPGNHTGTYQIGLSSPGTPPDPQPIKITWDFQPHLDNDRRSPSAAVIEYTVTYWYLQDGCF